MSNTPTKKIYLLDTNILINFSKWIPISLNKKFWADLSKALASGDWILLDVVVKEIKYDAELKKWCKAQNSYVRTISDDTRNRAVEINNQYTMIDSHTQKSTVDTYLVAYAEANNLVVFSQESPRVNSTDLYKIPDVCKVLNIQRIKKPEIFFRGVGINAN